MGKKKPVKADINQRSTRGCGIATTTVVRLPNELADRLKTIAATRGSTISEVITFMMRDRDSKRVRIMKLGDNMKFGKYSGLSVESVIRNDPSYVEWLMNNVDRVEFDQACLDLMNDLEDV